MSRIIIRAALAAVMLTICSPLAAGNIGNIGDRSPASLSSDQSWYYNQPTSYQPNPRQIIHQKAQARALARQARLASLRWYGMSNSRPTAASTPFMSLYSPVWQMPGGRPFAWYTSRRPVYVVWYR